MKKEEIIKTFKVIKKSGELVFEHYKVRGFKNSLIEVGIQNIIEFASLGSGIGNSVLTQSDL